MLASVALVGCTNTDEPEVNNGNETQKGDAYVTVKLAMSGNVGSRASQENQFVVGDPKEVAVNKAIFYFFDANGQGCADKFEMDNTNRLIENLTWDDSESTGVDQESGAIVVIKNPIATPASMLVLLNCDDPTASTMRPSLAQLQAATLTTGNLVVSDVNYHIMSNAVYVNEGTVMVGTPITSDNITISANDKELGANDEGDKNVNGKDCVPVVVSVERLWAKVGMTPTNGFTDDLTAATGTSTGDYTAAEGKTYDIRAYVEGWWLASKANKTYLIKNLSEKYEAAPFISTSTWWNDASKKRSYWANMPSGVGYTNLTTWNGAKATNATEYCLENTSNSIDGSMNQNGPGTATQYAAKAVLKLKNSEGNYVATTFVRYLNKIYSESDFFNLLAENYNNYVIAVTTTTGEEEAATSTTAYYFLNGTPVAAGGTNLGKTAFTWEYNETQATTGSVRKDYEGEINVVAPTAVEGETTTYALAKITTTSTGAKEYTTCVAEDITALQASIDARIGKVLLWLDGQTYYYTDILHNGDEEEVQSPLYGVVRNHLYTLNVTGLTGMGTPVPNGNLPINPERPEGDVYSHISAEVQILSYKVVPTQDVVLQ